MDQQQSIKEQIALLRRERSNLTADKRSLVARRENAKRAAQQATMLGGDPFYYRVSMDFRGRLYYKGAHMNPQMGDDIKAVLKLANKKPLGNRGLAWLLWGIASAAGYDKASFDDRVQWSAQRTLEIREAVEDPLNSKLFTEEVMTGGEPALFLQRATEMINALDSDDIANYETDVLIAMDATCSGLQILSAVARDGDGGALVNIRTLPNQPQKSDVYSTVAKEILARYAAMPENFFASWMVKYGLPRRFTKRSVMTLPYSATIRSAVGYVKGELQGDLEKGINAYPLPESREERLLMVSACSALLSLSFDDDDGVAPTPEIDDNSLYHMMARVVARDIHAVCFDTIPAAMKLLAFFKQTPKYLPEHALWTTPDGLRVKQIYGAKSNLRLFYDLEIIDQETGEIRFDKIQRVYQFTDNSEKNRSKSSNGMSPNWVHSLDGTLVRRVMLKCPFEVVAIHDSFAAHPADCDDLSRVLREQFKWLVETDPLGTLISQLNKQAGAEVFDPAALMVNTWSPDEALDSEFLFC